MTYREAVQRSSQTPPAARTATTMPVGPEPGNAFKPENAWQLEALQAIADRNIRKFDLLAPQEHEA